eukprot:403359895
MAQQNNRGQVNIQMTNETNTNTNERDKQVAMKFMRERVIDYDARDAEVWRLITDVPFISTPWQYVCFILNVIIPGTGTMLSSGFTEKWSKTLFMVGLFQLFLAYILIGWVFSIYWGWLIVRRSWQDKQELDKFLQNTQLRSDQQQNQPGGPGSGQRIQNQNQFQR